jgi:hypothetical protein
MQFTPWMGVVKRSVEQGLADRVRAYGWHGRWGAGEAIFSQKISDMHDEREKFVTSAPAREPICDDGCII